MKVVASNIQEYLNSKAYLAERDKQERIAIATLSSDTLSKLNISIDSLPQKYQHLLKQVATTQAAMGITHLDPISLSLIHSKELSSKLEDEYEILLLKQKNAELQAKIDRNKKFLKDLRSELEYSKNSLASKSPNPDNIYDHIRHWRQKVASYEESYEKAKIKFINLSVPDEVYPKSLCALAETLAALKTEAENLQQRADDVTLARDAMDTFNRLRQGSLSGNLESRYKM